MDGKNRIVRWRATGQYRPTSVLKSAFLTETREYLLAFARTGNLDGTRQTLVGSALPQRSIYSRATIAKIIRMRIASWNPPSWVLDDLVMFASDSGEQSLPAALLLHVARQDSLLYDFVQTVVVPRWESGDRSLIRSDVQRFLDDSEPEHPEIATWSHLSRQKMSGNALTILRDYGILCGTQVKHIVEPVVPLSVACHLVKLLLAEGVCAEDVSGHPDWRLWLWTKQRVAEAVKSFEKNDRDVSV